MPVVFTPYLEELLSREREQHGSTGKQDSRRASADEKPQKSATNRADTTGTNRGHLVEAAVAGVVGLAATYWVWKRQRSQDTTTDEHSHSESGR